MGGMRPDEPLIDGASRTASGRRSHLACFRRDELGRLSTTVAVFKSAMLETARLRAQQADNEQRAEAEKRAALAAVAGSFDRSVGGIVATSGTMRQWRASSPR